MTDLIPMEFNVVVELDAVQETTAGGIILPQKTVDADKLAAEEGTLVALSPLAFSYAEWPADARKPQVGDRVLISRFAGVQRDRGGQSFKILKDKDVMAIISAGEPWICPECGAEGTHWQNCPGCGKLNAYKAA